MRALRGTPGTKVTLTVIRGNAADPHVVELTREAAPASDVNGRMAAPGVGYVRVAAIGADDRRPGEVAGRAISTKSGASTLIVDVRRTSGGDARRRPRAGAAVRRPGHAGHPRGARAARARPIAAARRRRRDHAAGRRSSIDTGTSGAAELFAAALLGQQARRADRRAHDRPRRRTEAGQAARRQRPLADHHALSHARRQRRSTRRASSPTVAVDEPDVEFGQPPPTSDPVLDKALERLDRRRRPRRSRDPTCFNAEPRLYTERSSNACIFKI